MSTAIPLFYAYGLRNCLVQELILHVEASWDEYLEERIGWKLDTFLKELLNKYL